MEKKTTKNINEKQDDLIKNFISFGENLEEATSYIVDKGKLLPLMEDALKNEDNLVIGCSSHVWISYTVQKEIMTYKADSNSLFLRGMLALFLEVLNGVDYNQIVSSDFYFLSKINLISIVGHQRALGLAQVTKKFKELAIKEKIRPRRGRKPKEEN